MKRSSSLVQGFSGVCFILFGMFLLVMFVVYSIDYHQKNEVYADGISKVVDYKYNDDNLRAIVVEYVVDGHLYYATSSVYSSYPKAIGTEVKIKYSIDDPSEMIWKNDSRFLFMLLLGFAFTIVGVWIIVSVIKNKGKVTTYRTEEEIPMEKGNMIYGSMDKLMKFKNFKDTISSIIGGLIFTFFAVGFLSS